MAGWSHRQESNLYLALRRRPFYPLNYGGTAVDFLMAASAPGACEEKIRPFCERSVEHFQWLTEDQSKVLPDNKRSEVELELADIFTYLVRLADKLDIDLLEAAEKKLKMNAEKYPADVVRGSAKKYTEY